MTDSQKRKRSETYEMNFCIIVIILIISTEQPLTSGFSVYNLGSNFRTRCALKRQATTVTVEKELKNLAGRVVYHTPRFTWHVIILFVLDESSISCMSLL